ncbi:B12-binding domain-containing radical SAM protein [Acidobacteriota bacterium]
MPDNILLIYPPQADPTHPALALPVLKACLERHGYRARVFDMNLLAWLYYLQPSRLEASYRSIKARIERLESKASLAYEDQREYFACTRAFLARAEVLNHIEEALDGIRDPNTYERPEDYDRHAYIVERAINAYSAEHWPSLITISNLIMRKSAFVSESLSELAHLEGENPFIELYKREFFPVFPEPPRLVGLSVLFGTQLIAAYTLATMIKKAWPQTHICLGGGVVSSLGTPIAKVPALFEAFDSVQLFEAEENFPQAVRCILDGRDLEDVPNLVYRAPAGDIRTTRTGPSPDPTDIPPPDFHDLDLEDYLSPEPVLPYLTARGCTWRKCAFCRHYSLYRGSYRALAPEQVARELAELSAEYGTQSFYFVDESIPAARFDRIATEIIKTGSTYRIFADGRLEKGFTPERCARLSQAGLREVALGLESGCQRILDHMEKGIRIDEARQCLENFTRAGIWTHVMLFFGFPSETEEEARETVGFIKENRDTITTVGISAFDLEKGSRVEQDPARYGISAFIPHPERFDLTSLMRYEVRTGLSKYEAVMFSERVKEDKEMERFGKRFPALGRIHGLFMPLDKVAGKSGAREPAGQRAACNLQGRIGWSPEAEPRLFKFDLNVIGSRASAWRFELIRMMWDENLSRQEAFQRLQESIKPMKDDPAVWIKQPGRDELVRIERGAADLIFRANEGASVEDLLGMQPLSEMPSILSLIALLTESGVITLEDV